MKPRTAAPPRQRPPAAPQQRLSGDLVPRHLVNHSPRALRRIMAKSDVDSIAWHEAHDTLTYLEQQMIPTQVLLERERRRGDGEL